MKPFMSTLMLLKLPLLRDRVIAMASVSKLLFDLARIRPPAALTC